MINPDSSIQPESLSESLKPNRETGDVTRKETEHSDYLSSLRDRQLRAFFEGAIDAMVIVDDEGRYLDANPAAWQLFGLSQADLQGRKIKDFCEPGFDFIHDWQTLQEEDRVTGEFRLMRLDGTMREVEYSATANFLPHRHLVVIRDLTQHKQLERELAQSNANLEQRLEHYTEKIDHVLQNICGVVASSRYYADHTRLSDFISPSCKQLYGYTSEEFSADDDLWLSRVFPADRDPLLAQIYETVFSSTTATVDYRFYHKDGSLRWISETFISRYDSDLDCWKVVTVGLDVTRLMQDKERLALALAGSGDGLWDWNILTSEVYFSPRWLHMLGYEVDELPGNVNTWQDLIHPEDYPAVMAILKAHLQDDRHPYKFEYRLRTKSGDWKWIANYGKVVRQDDQGNPQRMTGTHRDVSQIKQTEIVLTEQQALLKNILDGTRDLIAALDLEYRFIAFNSAYHDEFLKIFGYDIQVGTSLVEALANLPQDQQNALALWKRALQGEEFTVIQEFGDQSLKRRYYEITYSSIRAQQGQRIGASHIMRDVTEQQAVRDARDATEALLRESEANLAAAQRLAHIGNWKFDTTTGKITWSEELFRIYGLNPNRPEPNLDEHIRLIHPEDREKFQSTVQQALLAGDPYVVEFRGIRPDGSMRVVEGRGEAIRDSSGWVIGLFGTAQDITDRKQLENALRLQAYRENTVNQFLQMVRQSMDLSILFPAAAATIAQLTEADRVQIVQYHPEQKLWRNVSDYRRSDDLPDALGLEIPDMGNEIARRLKRMEIVVIDDASQLPDDINQELAKQFTDSYLLVPIQIGTTVWGAVSLIKNQCSAFWHNADLNLLRMVAEQLAIAIHQAELQTRMQQLNATLERQVKSRTAELQSALFFETALKRLTDTIRDSLEEQEILQAAVEELAFTLNICSCDIALYNNEHTASTIRYDYTQGVHSAQGQTCQMSNFPEAYAQLLQRHSIHFCKPFKRELDLRPDTAQCTIFACPLIDDQRIIGDMWLYKSPHQVFNDLEIRLVQQIANQCTIALRQARLYQESQAYSRELEKLNQHKDELLTTVTHELRAPLANIKMSTRMLEILVTSGQTTNDRVKRYFQILKQECDRETRLINDLLDLARVESGQLQLNLVPIELLDFLTQIAAPFEQGMLEHDQTFQLNLATDLPSFTTDPIYLERILSELLHNACKYTPSKENIILSAQSHVETIAAQSLTHLVFRVTNTGIEIPLPEQSRIFEKFYRLPEQDQRKAGGTGLGLALVKKLAECLGGVLELESSSGCTTFSLKFLIE